MTCKPVGSALPPRRGAQIVSAAAAELTRQASLSRPVVIPEARDRALEYYQRRMSPVEVAGILEQSTSGTVHGQQLLFQAMLDSWPRLQKNMAEVKRAARKAPWKVVPWTNRRDEPSARAQERADFVEDAIWNMTPTQQDVIRRRKGFEGMVELLVEGYFTGHQVIDLLWDEEGKLPKASAALPARFYAYPYEGEERLMFDREGMGGSLSLEDFPDHKVLIAINGSHNGNPVAAAPLRALTGYWLAATFGLKWLLSYAEKFGQPIRWAEYAAGDEKAKADIERMMINIGSNAWGIFPAGTKMNFVESTKNASGLPQRDLIDLADQQCDIFMLGQTLTSSVGDSGSRALGDVHMRVRDDVIRGICDFVGEILSYQLCPSICALNFPADSGRDLPGIWAVWPETKDEKAMAERDNLLGVGTRVPVSLKWFYERHGIPVPAPDEDLFVSQGTGTQAPLRDGSPSDEEQDPVEASDASWVRFPSGSGTLGIPRSEMPQIRSKDRGAMVQFFRARGVDIRKESVPASSLKPTQAEYSPAKVENAVRWGGGNRSILVSDDNHVVDGHHQWMAHAAGNETIPIIRLMAPISRVLMMAHRMPSTKVAASIREDLSDGRRSKSKPLTVDRLSESVLEGLTGVTSEWLGPVKPFFDRLAALAMSKTVSDADFIAALEDAQSKLPELFDLLDTEALQEAFEEAIGSAALSGSVSRYEKPSVRARASTLSGNTREATNKEGEKGRWVTHRGRRIFIKDGDNRPIQEITETQKEIASHKPKDPGLMTLEDLSNEGYTFHRGKNPEASRDIVQWADDHTTTESYGENVYVIKKSDLKEIPDYVMDYAREYYNNPEDLEDIVNPKDIVDSAGAWDDRQFVSDIWQEFGDRFEQEGIIGFKTRDGAITFPGYGKESGIHHVKSK